MSLPLLTSLSRGRALNCDQGWQLLDSWMGGVAKWVIYWNYEGREYETPSRVYWNPDRQPKGCEYSPPTDMKISH